MRILVTGANSFIGTSFEKYMNHFSDMVDTVDTMSDEWRKTDFSKYDSVFHVAGLAHANPDPSEEKKYFSINCDFAYEVAKAAKDGGAKQFIYMSSIIVYGSAKGEITSDTNPEPDNFYGGSKLLAEEKLKTLDCETFRVAIIRAPMIYGPGSKGNYPRLSKLSKIAFAFPNLNNKRSMLYIDNLSECVRLISSNQDSGTFYPQNAEYVNTAYLVREIRGVHNKRTFFVNIFNPIIRALSKRTSTFSKLFGDLYYDKALSGVYDFSYCVVDFKSSVKKTEAGK